MASIAEHVGSVTTGDGKLGSRVTVPRPVSLVLRNFSLYQRVRTVEVDFGKDVFCLAGANGLGKSTFLAALNFAITGVVPKPDLNFLGASKFYEDTQAYSRTFFEGRITATDYDVAEVEVRTVVGSYEFQLVRGMFSPTSLRKLRVKLPDGSVDDLSASDISDSERHSRYVAYMLEASGLTSFAQLVFLQWFVLTFDEQRHLLFWSDRIAEQAIFLAFGISAQAAEQAEALQRSIDSADSKARNLQWQATGVRKRLDALDEALGGGDNESEEDVAAEHEELASQLDLAGTEHGIAVRLLAEAQTNLDSAVNRHLSAVREYENAFERRVAFSSVAHLHPLVKAAVSEAHCQVCQASGPAVTASVTESLNQDLCPLCGSDIAPVAHVDPSVEDGRLIALSEEVVLAEEAVNGQRDAVTRQVRRLDTADRALREIRRRLDDFRSANTQALLRGVGDAGLVHDARNGLQREISNLLEQKDLALVRRETARGSLNALRAQLSSGYEQMEDEFVPMLRELAFEFLGVPLDVDLDRRSTHLGLNLSFKGSQRVTPDSLSESQRFFIDIALRMALARQLSREGTPATLYIDTPEGSLDIAYEGRAGRMFGLFAQGDDRIIMTANINTSRLLQELARVCGVERMELVRMTDWSELSAVQQDAEGLFEAAYAGIEANLHEGRHDS